MIRDQRSEATFVFVQLDPTLAREGVTAWLRSVTGLVQELTAPAKIARLASVAVGFGPSFFNGAGGPRFGLAPDRVPAGFSELPTVSATDPLLHTDVVFYVMSLSQALVARFLQGLAATVPVIAGVTTASGFQRGDGRELGGFRDGLRNTTSTDRASVVFVDREEAPDEPDWLQDGTYMAYLRVREDVEALTALPLEQQERIFGRRKEDGSRFDLPGGTPPKDEGPIGPAMPGDAHAAKAGPRGDHDDVAIFRRGVPYLQLSSSGKVVAGLHFVSFQARLANFEVILNRWMLNPDFPKTGAGVDALFARGLATIERAAFFVVPPADQRFVGAPMFDPARPPVPEIGRLIVHKKVVDSAGNPALVELGNIAFQVFSSDGQAIGPAFITRSNGLAISPDIPMHQSLVLRELAPPPNSDGAAEIPFTLTRHRDVQIVVNHRRQPGPYGGT